MQTQKRTFRWLALLAMVLVVALLAACSSEKANDEAGESAKPSNGGGPGAAVNLTGNADNGAKLFVDNCATCHGDQGKGGVENPGSKDGTVPPLNPIDASMVNKDAKTYATNIDLFIEHGSTPEGDSPSKVMSAFGDNKTLQPQEIADLIAYVMSLNPAK